MNKQTQGIMAANMGFSNLTELESSCESMSWMCTNGMPNGCELYRLCMQKAKDLQNEQNQVGGETEGNTNSKPLEEKKKKTKNTLFYVGGAILLVGSIYILTRK